MRQVVLKICLVIKLQLVPLVVGYALSGRAGPLHCAAVLSVRSSMRLQNGRLNPWRWIPDFQRHWLMSSSDLAAITSSSGVARVELAVYWVCKCLDLSVQP